MSAWLLLLGLGALAQPLAPTPPSGPRLLLLVRHAEKAVTPDGDARDPPLSAAGQQRAEALAQALAPMQVDAILVSRWQRTQQTAAPLARQLHLRPEVVEGEAGQGLNGHLDALLAAIERQRGVVLVIGHSNTLPLLVQRLGGPAPAPICEQRYSGLWLLLRGQPPRLGALRYGPPDPPEAAGCP